MSPVCLERYVYRMELVELLGQVRDPATFLQFARALAEDRGRAEALESRSADAPFGPNLGGWENVRISTFLGAAIAWAEDSSFGQEQGLQLASNPWHGFAAFLYCGKIYE